MRYITNCIQEFLLQGRPFVLFSTQFNSENFSLSLCIFWWIFLHTHGWMEPSGEWCSGSEGKSTLKRLFLDLFGIWREIWERFKWNSHTHSDVIAKLSGGILVLITLHINHFFSQWKYKHFLSSNYWNSWSKEKYSWKFF